MIKKYPKILYFIAGNVPTEDEQLEALKLGFNVGIRSAKHVNLDENPEKCEGVAGLVPVSYQKIPKAEKVIEDFLRGITKKNENAEKKTGKEWGNK